MKRDKRWKEDRKEKRIDWIKWGMRNSLFDIYSSWDTVVHPPSLKDCDDLSPGFLYFSHAFCLNQSTWTREIFEICLVISLPGTTFLRTPNSHRVKQSFYRAWAFQPHTSALCFNLMGSLLSLWQLSYTETVLLCHTQLSCTVAAP